MLAVMACIGVQPAQAQTEETCTYGGAQALLLEAPVAATQFDRSDRPHLGELWEECQFRLYRDGETVTFREGDYILGAIAVWWTYKDMNEFGWSREQAIEDLRLVTDRIEVADVNGRKRGPFEPVPVIVTSYRDAELFGTHTSSTSGGSSRNCPPGSTWCDGRSPTRGSRTLYRPSASS
jgi:hypothetical protein